MICHRIKINIVFILILSSVTIFAQNHKTIDSLKSIIKNSKTDTLIIKACLSLANEYRNGNANIRNNYYTQALNRSIKIGYKKGMADVYVKMADDPINSNNFTTAFSLLNKAITIYKQIGLNYNEMQCYNNLAVRYFYKGDNYKALDYLSLALGIARTNHYEKFKALIYSNVSLVYIRLGDYEKANENNFNALRIFQKFQDKLQIARCKLSIGSLFFKLPDYDKAFKYIGEAMNEFKAIGDSKGYSICLSNIGSIYSNRKNYQKALQYFLEAVAIDKKNNDLDGISSNYNSIGITYFKLKKYETAMKFYRNAGEIYQKTGDINGMATSYMNISRLENERKNFTTAEYYCNASIPLFTQSGDLDQKRNALELLADIYYHTGRFDKAYNTFSESAVLKDSLFNIEKAKKIAILEEKFLNEKLEKENLTLKFKNDLQSTKITNQRKLNYAYLITIILSITAIIIIVIQYRKKNTAYKFIVKKNMDLISKEHEIKEMRNQMRNVLENSESKSIISEDEKEKVMKRLEKLLDVDKIYTKTDLTIEKLAKRLNTNRTYLSQIINDEYNKKYTDFINDFRVKEAMLMLSDPQKNHKYSIEAIAKEAGFNTISNFNSVFKKYTGITPSVFKKETDNQSNITLG